MHGNQWVLKIAVLKYYSVSKRGTTAKSNPKQATDPISLHTKFGDNSSNTFPLNERKPCVTPDIGRRTPDIGHRTSDIGQRTSDIGHRTSDGEKSKNNISTPQGGGHNNDVVQLHPQPFFLPSMNFLQGFKGQGYCGKVESRLHDIAHYTPTNIPTKYELLTPYSFYDIAWERFSD